MYTHNVMTHRCLSIVPLGTLSLHRLAASVAKIGKSFLVPDQSKLVAYWSLSSAPLAMNLRFI